MRMKTVALNARIARFVVCCAANECVPDINDNPLDVADMVTIPTYFVIYRVRQKILPP